MGAEPDARPSFEASTHNIYFHEDSPVLSVDAHGDTVATCGCDRTVRLWRVVAGACAEGGVYHTAANSTVAFEHACEFGGFAKPINCIRFRGGSGPRLLAACADGGRVVAFIDTSTTVVREDDGDDAYDLCWGDDRLFVGFASGKVEMHALEEGDKEDSAHPEAAGKPSYRFALLASKKVHTGTIQGMSYNRKHGLVGTHGLDRKAKVLLVTARELKIISVFDSDVDNSRGLFKRLLFTDDHLYAITRGNTVSVYSYPFRPVHLQKKMGPFNSSVVKIVEGAGRVFVCTKKSVYVFENDRLVVCVDSLTFMAVTDACICGDTLVVSAMDGFLASLRPALPEGGETACARAKQQPSLKY